ncbi:MAG: hypothetical protein LBN98_01980 [Prevotellaceae bacterium]|nr:hypothetical protein [Prevotellaceae bacterium]
MKIGWRRLTFNFQLSPHHHITTSPHHHITTSPHHHIITSPHHHITTSSHHSAAGKFFAGKFGIKK